MYLHAKMLITFKIVWIYDFLKLHFIWWGYMSKNVETTALDKRLWEASAFIIWIDFIDFQMISWSGPSLYTECGKHFLLGGCNILSICYDYLWTYSPLLNFKLPEGKGPCFSSCSVLHITLQIICISFWKVDNWNRHLRNENYVG